MPTTMIEIAKQKDDGSFAKMGMRQYCADWFNVPYMSKCTEYIVDTYLECIDEDDFDTWIKGLSAKHNRPFIIKREELEHSYKDLLQVSDDLNIIVDLFMYLYDKEFFVDELTDCIYSTDYRHDYNRKRLNFIGIAMEYERLCTLHQHTILDWKDIDTMVNVLNDYGYDIEADYKYRVKDDIYETAQNIEERLSQIFGL